MKRYLLLLIFISTIFSACNSKKEDQQIKIATLKGPSAMGMVKMIENLNENKNSDIEITIYNEPIRVRKLMLKGEVDFAILPTTMGAILYNKGVPYQLAAIPVWGTLYLFGNDTSITTWDDLKGKKINLMAKGMTPDVLFKQLLIKNNIDPEKDVTLDYTFPTHIDLANAVAAGQAELGVISEPLVSLVMQKNKKVAPIFDLNTEWQKVYEKIPIAQTALLVNKDFAANNKEQLQFILNEYKNSTDWVNNNIEDAAKLIVKYKILPNAEVAESSIPRSNLNFIEANTLKKQISDYFQIFYEMNPDIIGGKIPDKNFYLNCEE
ncbi:MAG: ABC transporter substrate-binding protein [Bacteroidales bacterium]|nr:ABC transporter substrate-binding protein [Bacteroidales bacterium]